MYCFISHVFFQLPWITEMYTYGHTLSLHNALPISFANGLLGRAAPRGVPGQMVEHPVECRGQPGDFVAASDGCPVVERFRVYDRAYRRFEFAKRRREAASAPEAEPADRRRHREADDAEQIGRANV